MDEAMISLWNQRVNRDGCMLYGYRPVRLNEIVKVNRTIGLSAETLVFA